MSISPLHTTLGALRAERVDVQEHAAQLRDELNSSLQRLMHLNGAIDNIEALLGVPNEDDQAVLSDDGVPTRDDDGTRPAFVIDVDFSDVPDPDPPRRKRVPSTDWVAEIVDAIGEPAGRDAIYEKLQAVKGIPESWVANPRNSFNNALGRAVERGLIAKLGDDLFAPNGYSPFAEADFEKPEGS